MTPGRRRAASQNVMSSASAGAMAASLLRSRALVSATRNEGRYCTSGMPRTRCSSESLRAGAGMSEPGNRSRRVAAEAWRAILGDHGAVAVVVQAIDQHPVEADQVAYLARGAVAELLDRLRAPQAGDDRRRLGQHAATDRRPAARPRARPSAGPRAGAPRSCAAAGAGSAASGSGRSRVHTSRCRGDRSRAAEATVPKSWSIERPSTSDAASPSDASTLSLTWLMRRLRG